MFPSISEGENANIFKGLSPIEPRMGAYSAHRPTAVFLALLSDAHLH